MWRLSGCRALFADQCDMKHCLTGFSKIFTTLAILCSVWQSCERIMANLSWHWAIFHCCKSLIIIHPSGHAACACDRSTRDIIWKSRREINVVSRQRNSTAASKIFSNWAKNTFPANLKSLGWNLTNNYSMLEISNSS